MGCCNRNTNKVSIPPLPPNTPIIESDGSVVFPEDVEIMNIQGYEVDPEDDRRLIPIGAGCSKRMTGIMLQRDGTFAPHHVCMHNQCEHKSKPVTFDICEGCPLRDSL